MRAKFLVLYILCSVTALAQTDFEKKYYEFRDAQIDKYVSHRDECNQKYAEHLKNAWARFESKEPIPTPDPFKPIPPRPYDKSKHAEPVVVAPVEEKPVAPAPQPKPVAPIPEVPAPVENVCNVSFYGINAKVRLDEKALSPMNDVSPSAISARWRQLSDAGTMNNTVRDCLEARIRYNLSDWAYLSFLLELGRQHCAGTNAATMLAAYIYCQSGYQMRLGVDGNRLLLLYGSKHQIFDKKYFTVAGVSYYIAGDDKISSIMLCDAAFDGETPLSLYISGEQSLGNSLTDSRTITSKKYPELSANVAVPHPLIQFFDKYPSSAVENNFMTRWAMYANTPLSGAVKEKLYPHLKANISGLSKLQAAERLLNWVQTGFVYEYDDKVWGHDRAFFAEETLYYPYCDCEDRSILFSRLVRDLLGLDVALVYYPGHLATAVCFDEDVRGDMMTIGGRRFTVCDPTYIGAPVGKEMPNLEHDKAQAIVLK